MNKLTFLKGFRWSLAPESIKSIFSLCCLLLFVTQSSSAQTLINPAAEGGFENGTTFAANGWTTVNDATSTWSVGTAPGWFTGTRGAYVSNDAGTSWAFTNNVISRSAFYRDVTFPTGATTVTLNFDWRANGNDTNWDNLLVYVIDTSVSPTTAGPTGTNTTTTGWTGYTNGTTGYFLLQRNGTTVPTTTTAVTYSFTAAQLAYVSGSTKRLVFVWKNDSSGGTNPPASVDNISLEAIVPSCLVPSALTAGLITTTTAAITWTEPASLPSLGYEFELRTSGAAGSGATGLVSTGSAPVGTMSAGLTGLSANTSHTYYLRSSCGASDFSTWASVAFSTLCDPPSITGTSAGSICGQGSVTLAATSSAGDLKWYAAATGGTTVGTGSAFTTPLLTTTTSYWVEASTPGSLITVGPASPTSQGGTTDNQTIAWNVNFTVVTNTTLASVDVFPISAGQTGAIIVRSSTGTTIATYPYTTTVSGGATAQTVVLNHVFVPGDYQLYPTLPTGGLKRNTTGAIYPYTSAAANITGNGFSAVYYMGFYNWTFGANCASPRTEVIATVSAAPTIALSTNNTAAVCAGQSSAVVILAVGSTSYNNYVWSPTTNVTGDASIGWTFNPNATTTYTLLASQTSRALCQTSASLTVNVNPNPTVYTSVSNATICEGTFSTLTATTDTAILGNVTLGTGTTLTAATAQPTAFCNRFKQYWNQTIYTAAELQAAGLRAGNVNSITYNITTLGSGTNVTNFEIRIGTTSNTTTTSFITTGLSQVFGPATYAHTVGLNTVTFDTPYNWDGISNIVLDVRQVGADSTNNANTYYTATPSNMTISAVTSTAPATNTIQTLVSTAAVTPSLSLQRLNVVFAGQVATTGAGTLGWTWSPGALTGNAVTVSPTVATTYTVRGTNAITSCFTEASAVVAVNLAPAPTGDSIQTFSVFNSTEATVANLVAVGNIIVWYATQADALAQVNPLASTTELVNGEDYFAMQTTAQGCTSVAPLSVTVSVTLGNSSFELQGLKYYPNPVTNVLNLEYTGTIISIEVFTMLGQKIVSKDVSEISTTIDLSDLASGSYFVKVKAENGSKTIKVMKN